MLNSIFVKALPTIMVETRMDLDSLGKYNGLDGHLDTVIILSFGPFLQECLKI